jgi:hypothetical protein
VATGGSSNPTLLLFGSEEFPHLRLCIAAYALQIAVKNALFAHDNLFGALQHIAPYRLYFSEGWRVAEARHETLQVDIAFNRGLFGGHDWTSR